MERALRIALQAALVGDSRSYTVASATTTSIVLTTSPAAVPVGATVRVTGSIDRVVCLDSVTTATKTLALAAAEALPQAPIAGDAVVFGARNWLRYVSATDTGIHQSRRLGTDVAAAIVASRPIDRRCVLCYAPRDLTRQVFDRHAIAWTLRLYGQDPEWLEGFTEAVRRLLDADIAAVSPSGLTVQSLELSPATEPVRTADKLYERSIAWTAAVVREEAA